MFLYEVIIYQTSLQPDQILTLIFDIYKTKLLKLFSSIEVMILE